MITGSHNPPEYNGFKMLLNHRPFFGPDIQNLPAIAEKLGKVSPSLKASSSGRIQFHDIRSPYVARLLRDVSLSTPPRRLRIGWDPGNGAVGAVLSSLLKGIDAHHHIINGEVDGLFPAHHPDPTIPENLEQLRHMVLTEKCDLGIAFDGDGDRIGVIDGEGDILWGDQLLAFYSQDLLKRVPGATIIADVKASQILFDWITERGGVPVMVPSGHSIVKARMAETGALLAGEMSGHIFFAEGYYGYDDAVYAAVRLLHLLATQPQTLCQFKRQLPVVFNTPELRFSCPDSLKFLVIKAVKESLDAQGETYSAIDGARVQTEEGWWLLRASNTQDVLVARCESDSSQGLDHLKDHLRLALEKAAQTVKGFTPSMDAGH
jgi:phosphomannomutase